MKKVLFLYKTPRKKIYEDWRAGNGPDTTLYGANQLEKLGYNVNFFDVAFSKLNPLRWFFYPIHLMAAKTTGIGFKIDQAISLLPAIYQSDVIVSTIDTAGLPIILLKKLRIINKPVIYISVDFAFRIQNNNKWPFNWYKHLLKYADVIICYDEAEKEILNRFNKNIYFLHVGVDTKYFADSKLKTINKNKKKIILAFGRDRDRDYQIFANAIGKLKAKGEIVCSKENIRDLELPPNVKVSFDLPAQKLKQKIFASDIVVIPIKNVERPGGHLSLLDSMLSKRPVIISGNKWISSAFNFKNNEDCLYFESENKQDLKNKINLLINNPNLSKKLAINAYKKAKIYSTRNFALKLANIIEKLVN